MYITPSATHSPASGLPVHRIPPLYNDRFLCRCMRGRSALYLFVVRRIRLGLFERQLRRHQTPESSAFPSTKLGIRSFLGNLARLKDHDSFGASDGRESMGDEDDGDLLAMDDVIDGRVDCMLTRAIQRRGGFVEEQDAGFPDERSRDGNCNQID